LTGTPIAIELSGTSLLTTALAPIIELLPTLIPSKTTASAQITTFSPILGYIYITSSKCYSFSRTNLSKLESHNGV